MPPRAIRATVSPRWLALADRKNSIYLQTAQYCGMIYIAILEDGSCWLCIVWDPLEPNYELVRIQNPAGKVDHAKKEAVTARTFVIPANAIAKPTST